MAAAAAPSYAQNPQPGGVGRRFAATLLDIGINLLTVFAGMLVYRLLRALGVTSPDTSDVRSLWMSLGIGAKLSFLLIFPLSWGPLHYILFHASAWQASVGKRVAGLYVAGKDDQRITLLRSAGRWLALFVFGLFGGNFVSIVTIAASSQRKALHDWVAGTEVFSGRPPEGGALEAWRSLVAFLVPGLCTLCTALIFF